MKELINWYYQLQIDHLEQLNDIYYTKLGDRYIYIISVGKEKNTIFSIFYNFYSIVRSNEFYYQRIIQRQCYSRENTTMC